MRRKNMFKVKVKKKETDKERAPQTGLLETNSSLQTNNPWTGCIQTQETKVYRQEIVPDGGWVSLNPKVDKAPVAGWC